MLYKFFNFIDNNKFTLFIVLSIISLALIFIKPLIGFSIFFIALTILPHWDGMMKHVSKNE